MKRSYLDVLSIILCDVPNRIIIISMSFHCSSVCLFSANAVPSSRNLSTLMLEAAHTSKMSVLSRGTWHHLPETAFLVLFEVKYIWKVDHHLFYFCVRLEWNRVHYYGYHSLAYYVIPG
jgi:hypothetical protein